MLSVLANSAREDPMPVTHDQWDPIYSPEDLNPDSRLAMAKSSSIGLKVGYNVRKRCSGVKQPVTGHCKCTGCPSDCLVWWSGSECNHVRGIPTPWLSVPRTERLAGYFWVYTPCSCASTPISRASMIWSRNLLTPNRRMRRHDLRFKFHLANNHCRRSLWWRSVRTWLLMTFLKVSRFLEVLMEKRRLSSGSLWKWELVAKGKGMKSYYANQRPVFALWRRCRSPQTFSVLPYGSEPMDW